MLKDYTLMLSLWKDKSIPYFTCDVQSISFILMLLSIYLFFSQLNLSMIDNISKYLLSIYFENIFKKHNNCQIIFKLHFDFF